MKETTAGAIKVVSVMTAAAVLGACGHPGDAVLIVFLVLFFGSVL